MDALPLAPVSKPWREHPEDPWAEAERLEVDKVCKRLHWTTRRLKHELDRVASPEAFIARVAKALAELDAPRLLHRDSSRGYTADPHMAMRPDPGEAVGRTTQDEFAAAARQKRADAQDDLLAAAEDVRAAVAQRLESNPEFRRRAGRSIWRLRRELDHLILNTRNRAA